MRPKFYFRTCFTVLIDDVTNRQGRDFTHTHPGIDRKKKCQAISVSVSRRLDDPKYATNIVIRKDGCLCHFEQPF
jgi:hypothetical protein